MDQKPKNKNYFSGPSSNENSWVSESRDTIFWKKSTKKVSGTSIYFWMFLGFNRPVSI